jgi:hypothetical protein
MRFVHVVLGMSIVVAFGLMFLWGLATWLLRRGPGRGFWWVLTFVQASLGAQLAGGLVLLALGGREQWLHYVYGIVFPILVLGVAHRLAREAFVDRPWVAFGLAGLVACGLTLRAFMTGLGFG